MKKTYYNLVLIIILPLVFFINIEVKAEDSFYVGYGVRDLSPMEAYYNNEEKNNKNMPKVSDCDSKTLIYKNKAINPLPLQGYGNEKGRATEKQCIDPDSHIKATVVVIKDKNDYVVLLSADFVAIYSEYSYSKNNGKSDFIVSDIRSSIVNYIKNDETLKKRNITVKSNRIMLSATHNHSGPSFNYDEANIKAYESFVKRQINEAVKEALINMKKANISYDTLKLFVDANGKVTDSENYSGQKYYLGFVRHYKTKNYANINKKATVTSVGRGLFGFKCTDSTLSNCEKDLSLSELSDHVREPDYNMQVLKIDYGDNSKPILMLNWQAHPGNQGGSTRVVITADFIGYLRGYLEKKGYKVSYYQGAAGDINTYTRIKSKSFTVDGNAIMEFKYSDSKQVDAKNAVKIIGSKIGEIVDKRITSGSHFKKKVEYKNGIVFYKEGSKTEGESNIVDMYTRRWDNKDSQGNYLYNVDIYANAYFINKFNSAAEKESSKVSDDFKRIINGEYTLDEWKKDWNYQDQSGKKIEFRFPKILGKTPSEVSEKLISILMKNNSAYFYSMFIFEKNTQGVYKLTGYDKNTGLHTGIVNGRINPFLGAMMDDPTTPLDETITNNAHANTLINTIYKRTINYPEEDHWTRILNAFAIGNIGFVTAPYEMFSSNGKYIKNNSPYDMTFILAYSNGAYNGYLPDKESFTYKSYETDITSFVEETAEKNAKLLVNRLKDIYTIKIKDKNTNIDKTNIRIKIPGNYTLTYGELKNKISLTDKNVYVKNVSGNNITLDSEILGTGSKITIGGDEYTITIYGDVNGDGKVNPADYNALVRHFISIKVIPNNSLNFTAADMNKDGIISVKDYNELRRIFLGG